MSTDETDLPGADMVTETQLLDSLDKPLVWDDLEGMYTKVREILEATVEVVDSVNTKYEGHITGDIAKDLIEITKSVAVLSDKLDVVYLAHKGCSGVTTDNTASMAFLNAAAIYTAITQELDLVIIPAYQKVLIILSKKVEVNKDD